LANKVDLAVVRQLLSESLESLMEILPTLDVGEAVLWETPFFCYPYKAGQTREPSAKARPSPFGSVGKTQRL